MTPDALARSTCSLRAPASWRDTGTHCGSCGVRGLCLTAGLEPETLHELDAAFGTPLRLKKREALYRAGEPFKALYAIRLGTFKTVMLAEDGRVQVLGYHMTADVLGLDGMGDDRHACDAVALEDSEVCAAPFARLDEIARREPALRRNLFRLISRDVCRRQGMMLLLGSLRAEERLGAFLLNLAERYQSRGYSPIEFSLRMTREEIASYLGLQLETVSRLFSRLQEEGLIQVQGRAIKLLDSPALRRMAGLRI